MFLVRHNLYKKLTLLNSRTNISTFIILDRIVFSYIFGDIWQGLSKEHYLLPSLKTTLHFFDAIKVKVFTISAILYSSKSF